ncbi:phospholipase D family protein [Actinotalea sp. K2]|uniref:phospholipase D family protein n=1 Tax=Actinotalea sp. K2 TaxID=2939438 RepID=UPI002016D534|nr:phospholipase D family protein [Actinotalea sp. K2]MCL3862905.1 phospholipase D family protein [Actinotalea sp. K2]
MPRIPIPLRRDGHRLTAPTLLDVPASQSGEEAHDWFLTASQRGNDATRLRPWTQGNRVRALVHGSSYFAALAGRLARVGQGDLVMFADWRGDPDERVADEGPTVSQVLAGAAQRGASVKGLLWRSHLDRLRFSGEQNRNLSQDVNDVGGEVLLDQRVRPFGSHHQKFFVLRHPGAAGDDIAFLGGIDPAHGRRDDADHRGDPQSVGYSRWYGDTTAWHDVQIELQGPVVRDVEDVFRERWEDPAALSRLPWHVLPDLVRRLDRDAGELPAPMPDPPAAGTCAVQLLRTYPNRWPGYPFAPDGERSVARGYAKALRRARSLVYVEDQYLWSTDVARVFADALDREPGLHLVVVVPRYPDQEGRLGRSAARLGHAQALEMVLAAGGDRVQVLDVENHLGEPVYVHAKVCVVDDVWATVGSDNFNRRSWTHDSELTAAVLDDERDGRAPVDPAGLGDGARVFARSLRLELWREHLDRDSDDDLLDPSEAVELVRRSAAALDAWHSGGRVGPRPPGRLRRHVAEVPAGWQRWVSALPYGAVLDPDGRPPRMRVHGHH